MASTKEMMARAKARKTKQKKDSISLISEMGVKTYDSLDEYRKEVLNGLQKSAQNILENSNPANIDFSLFDKPILRTKELTIGGVKFRVHLHTTKEALAPLGRLYNKEFVSMFQIFNKAGSMLLPMTQATLDDAGHNFRNERIIDKNDILNRSVAALRLNSNSPVIHNIASHIAYEETCPGVSTQTLRCSKI